jgi:hypothetical protein
LDFAQCILGMTDVVAQSIDDAEKQKNGRIPVEATILLTRIDAVLAIARYSSIASTDMDRRSS